MSEDRFDRIVGIVLALGWVVFVLLLAGVASGMLTSTSTYPAA